MSFRPRAKRNAQLSAGSGGGTRYAAERLSSVLAVGNASFPLALMIPTNAGEHNSAVLAPHRLDVHGDPKKHIMEQLKKLRKRVFHKTVNVTTILGHCLRISYQIPDGIDMHLPSSNTSRNSNDHMRFDSKMRDVIAPLFPANPIWA